MPKLTLTHQYRWYLDNATKEVAERFLTAFDAARIKLARQPEFGRRLKFRAPELAGIRSYPVAGRFGVHLVFYRSDDRVLSIERVMHGARDLSRRLLETPEE